MRPKFYILLLIIIFASIASGQSIDIFTGGRAHWWDINDNYDMAVKASPSTTETWSAMWPISSGEPNSVLMTPGTQTNAQWVWATVDANIVDVNDSDANDVSIGLPDRTPWRVMYADANSFPLCEDPNLTFYRPEAALGVGLYHINVADVNANNYLQVYTLFDCEPNLLNVTIGRGSDDIVYGPNNTTIGYGAGDSMLNSYRNTLGGKDSGTSLTGGTDNSFWGYQAGKNITQDGTIRDEAYVIANNTNVVYFDIDWNVLSYEDFGVGSSSVCGRIIRNSDGYCIAGYGTPSAEGPCVTYWDTDLNADENYFVPDAGWRTSQVMTSGKLSANEDYWYVRSAESPEGIYKFDMSNGSEVWFLGTNVGGFDLDSSDNLYVFVVSGGRWNIYDSDSNLLDTYYAFMGWTGCRGVVYDETDDRIYACGSALHNGTTYYQVKARNWDGTSYDLYTWDPNNSDYASDILKIGEYIYVTATYRNQSGVGGAWANVYKLDESLNLVASYDTGATDNMGAYGLFQDHDGNLAIVTGNKAGGQNQAGVWILDTDLSYISDHQYNTDTSGVGTLSGTPIPYADANEGSKNTAIGSQALYGATDAEPNEATAGGYKSLYSVTTPTQATAYGAYSGYNITTADRGIYLGPYAGYNQTTLDDRFILDNRDRTSAADEITDSFFYGYIAADPNDSWLNINVGELNLDFARLDVNDVNVANDLTVAGNADFNDVNITGTFTVSGRLDVNDVNVTGTLTSTDFADFNDMNIAGDLTLETFSEGSILFTDADGIVSESSDFNYAESSGVLDVNAITVTGTANHNYGIDLSSGTWANGVMNYDQPFNIYSSGTRAMYFNDTSSIAVFGMGDAGNIDSITTANNLMIVGSKAGRDITSGNNLTLIGTLAGASITDGANVLAFGASCMQNAVSPDNSVAIGGLTLAGAVNYNRCVAVGVGAGKYAGTSGVGGYDLAIIGDSAGLGSNGNSAYYETCLFGSKAGYGLTSGGKRDILIGFKAGYNQTTLNDILIIDNRDRGSAANEAAGSLIYGVFSATVASQELTINGDLKVGNSTTQQIVSTSPNSTNLGVGETTFAISSNVVTLTGDGGGNTIATITGANPGTLLTIIFVDGNVQITDDDTHGADSVDLSAAFNSADDTTLQLVYDGTSWYETSRSTN